MLAVYVRDCKNGNKVRRVMCDKVEFGPLYAILIRGNFLVDAVPIERLDTIQAV